MKRFIITLIILLNIVIYSDKGYIGIVSLQGVRAQSQTGCWNPNSGSGGGFFNWLGTQISNAADAIANVANAIGEFFSSEDSGDGDGEQFGNEEGSEDWFEPSGPPDNFFNPMDDDFFTPEGFSQDEWDIMNHLDYWYAVYTNGGNPPTQDCAGVWGGSAYVGSCGICIGGRTGISQCSVDTIRTDTAKPTKIICDSAANARGDKLTRIRDSINANNDVQKVKDSALHSPNEAGVSITNNSGTYNSFNFKTGGTNSVEVLTSSPGQNIIAGIHSHGKGLGKEAANSPSPADLYHLLEGHQSNSNYIADFNFSHDSTEWALMISDPTAAASFLTSYPADSTLMRPDWDTTAINTATGSRIIDHYRLMMAYLYHTEHYPVEMIQGYANTVMYTQILNPGVRMYLKVNGQFKELNTEIIRDAAGTPIALKITICQ